MATALEWIKVVGPIVVSWPVFALGAVWLFRRQLQRLADRFASATEGKAEIGPIKIELGRLAEAGQSAVENLNRLNVLMAESRLLELEITQGKFGPMFSADEQDRMRRHIMELRTIVDSAKAKPLAPPA